MGQTILVTGGAGFIGSNFIKYIIDKEDINIVNLDVLTYAGNLENLKSVEERGNYHFVHGDINNKELVKHVCKQYKISGIINFAAESHVDRSVKDASPFIDSNVYGTLALLEVGRELALDRFLQVSTDEVYGSLGATGLFTESSNIQPNSPYSASKASADHMVMAYHNTYNYPGLITRCSNNYGSYQFPEKLIPLMILNARDNKSLPVYGDGMNVRDWIHVSDHCKGIWSVFTKGRDGEVYNLGGNCERTNIDIVRSILEIMGKPESLITYVKDRPGHDRRYAIDSSKIEKELGWKPEVNFEQGLKDTIEWYMKNEEWGNNVRSGVYKEYYKQQYGNY